MTNGQFVFVSTLNVEVQKYLVGATLKKYRENYTKKCFRIKEKETRILNFKFFKIWPSVSANRPSNHWAKCKAVVSNDNILWNVACFRDGSAVEIVGLCKSTVRWLAELSGQKLFPYAGVSKLQDGMFLLWALFTRQPCCPKRLKKLCFTCTTLEVKNVGARLGR